ncbi:MAG: trypsin-like peptidase domain-containing protein [Pirellulales bacterium]|nr:trypsin-like peptidase domain-containing protein [Pirellulales bacterium]
MRMLSRYLMCQGPRLALGLCGMLLLLKGPSSPAGEISEARHTPLVRAVQTAAECVVNIHGQKTITAAEDPTLRNEGPRRVNGMGTGVFIDERGYILTNHHVVDGVKRIEVTLADKTTHIAKFIASNAEEDLAVIKLDLPYQARVMPLGTSSDLLVAEPVIAMGNAYGYEHTVTRGIISALHRDVQISDTQSYSDLIQTDASINPGNSGGPLLNAEGQLIGINVAVRAGAAGIGFAIPVDKALDVAAELLNVERMENRWHGIEAKGNSSAPGGVVIQSVQKGSPAAELGLQPGDQLISVENQPIQRALDLERALIGRKSLSDVKLVTRRQDETLEKRLTLVPKPKTAEDTDQHWQVLGMKLVQAPAQLFKSGQTRYRGGLAVNAVRPDSPAAKQGIRKGDILVGMHVWETISPENVDYVINRPDFAEFAPLKFLIMRNGEVLFGHLPVTIKR